MNYPDLEFTLSLLLKGTWTQQASELLRGQTYPLELSVIHRLQIENGLLRNFHSSNTNRAKLARQGLLLWRHYLLERVFVIRSFDLEIAFQQAAVWNSSYEVQPPKWSLLLHPALALSINATFMSFNPRLRKCAADAGLKLLPASL